MPDILIITSGGFTRARSTFKATAVVERLDSRQDDEPEKRFCFSDLGDYDSTEAADERALNWARAWIDENYG